MTNDDHEQLEAARVAKSKVLSLFSKIGHVNGVGITRKHGRYAVKVNLEDELSPQSARPEKIDGVPVVVHVVGQVRKQKG